MTQTFTIVIEKSEDGYYAECPAIPGVYSQGDSEEEVLANIHEVLEMTLEDMKERGEVIAPISQFPQISFSAITVNA
jgi:predicted RNase H-like HicB family nuclease